MKTTTTRIEESHAHPGQAMLRAKDVTADGFKSGEKVVVLTVEDFKAITTALTAAYGADADIQAAVARVI